MKLTWLSNAPWAATGYGNQTKLFAPRINALGYETAIIAYYGLDGGVLNWNGLPVFPKGFHPYGQDIAAAHTVTYGADYMISLMDAWVCTPETFGDTKWIPWYPVDSEPISPPNVEKIKKAHKRIAMSRFGERMTHNAGLDCVYIPHGVDTKILKPQDMVASREKLQLPKDAFIVGMVAANKGNPSRKAFTAQIRAFAMLKEKHSDAVLYLHTHPSEHGEFGGVNLPEFIKAMGLEVGKDVYFPNRYDYAMGYPDDLMAHVYSAMDVKMLVSMGEGFGIPIVEAQACGVPVIVGEWTSMSELVFSGWKVDKSLADPWWTPHGAYQFHAHYGAVYSALEAAYNMRGNESYRKAARAGALAYDADKVTDKYWKPFLAELEAECTPQS